MQDNIPDALIAAFERQYGVSFDHPDLRNERLAMRYGWTAAMEQANTEVQAAWIAGQDEVRSQRPVQCLVQISEPSAVSGGRCYFCSKQLSAGSRYCDSRCWKAYEAQKPPAQAAVDAPVAVPIGARFFSFDPAEDLELHDTQEQAQAKAQNYIDLYREEGDGWAVDEVGRVCWGVVVEQATEVAVAGHGSAVDFVLQGVAPVTAYPALPPGDEASAYVSYAIVYSAEEMRAYAAAALSAQAAPVAAGEREALQAFVKFAESRKEELGGLSHEMQEVLDMARAALAATPAADESEVWPCVNIDVDEAGNVTSAKLYSPGLPAGNHDVYPVRVPYMDEHTEAWRACHAELCKLAPDFMRDSQLNGIESAVAAIRHLAAVPAPVVLPEPDAVVIEVMGLVHSLSEACLAIIDGGMDEVRAALDAQVALESKLRTMLAGVSAPAASEQDIEAAAKTLSECMDYPWAYMPEEGRANMRKHAKSVIAAANGGDKQ